MDDKTLWKPDHGSAMTSQAENERVRELLRADLAERVALMDNLGDPWGTARGEFAAEWVTLAAKLGLRFPGEEQRTSGGDRWRTAHDRHVDAAKTRLRQFMNGHNEFDWVLSGIESVVCDRKGVALPAGAYQTQERLSV